MAQLGFNPNKFPHGRKKKDAAVQPELTLFEPEEGAVVKKDEIDALFKEKKGDKTKKDKREKGVKEKKGKKRNKQEGEVKSVVEPEAVKAESASVADSLKAVMGALEGGVRQNKKKKSDGSGKQRTQNVMI